MLKLAISRCLLGDKVRYDGTDKNCADILPYTEHQFEIIPFCPEVAIGMGVPRLPMQLDKVNETTRARRINDVSYDYTDELKKYALTFSKNYPDLKAIISKKGSPSCGYNNAKLFSDNKIIALDKSGIFITELLQLLPNLLIIDELDFADNDKRHQFIMLLQQKSPD